MFNDRLRTIRMFRDITQQQLADAVNISLRSYQRYEAGSIEPPYQTLIAIADYLNVSIDFLFGRDQYLKSIGVSFDFPLESPPKYPRYKKIH